MSARTKEEPGHRWAPLVGLSATAPLCRLQDAYLDALEQCGGLHEARPKALLDMLSPRFPFLTLQARASDTGSLLMQALHGP